VGELAGGEGKHTIVLSSHILAEVTAICRRVIMVNEGRKTVDASLEELTAGGHTLEELFARETARDVAQAKHEASAEEVAQ
jgi:ABC-2 type transport system ATP-binding protein